MDRVDQAQTTLFLEVTKLSTLHLGSTDQHMLPQYAALEDRIADTPRGGNETDTIRTPRRSRRNAPLPRGDVPDTPAGTRHADSGSKETGSAETREGRPTGHSTTGHARVFVLDKNKKPLDPCHPARARKLLKKGRAVVVSVMPFVIRLKDRTVEESEIMGVDLFLDPGSKTTGIAVARVDENDARHVAFLAEVEHRGALISKHMGQRSGCRRRRRSKNLRYRAPRFNNRTKPKGWLAPSLQHRGDTTVSTVTRFIRYAPVRGIWQELVRFDMQQVTNPEISGVEYQQGVLAGYEVREYLLAKWVRQCAYCDATNVPLNIDHIVPKARGGSDRVSNLTLACIPCNQSKGASPIDVFLAADPTRLARILRQVQAPLKDAAAVNATRWALWRALDATGLPVRTGSGGQTKYNRTRFSLPKTHALDAVCVGHPDTITKIVGADIPTLTIKATGRGSYARTRSDKYGFPRLRLTRQKLHYGFQTGDYVRAVVPSGVKAGTHVGRVAVRASGSFNITTVSGTIQGINHQHVRLVQRNNGYGYLWKSAT